MSDREIGVLIVVAGAVAVVIGLLFIAGALSWVGRLPGDIRYSSGNVRVFAPLTTMVIVSVVASLLLWLIRRL